MKVELITKEEYYGILGENRDYFFVNYKNSSNIISYPYRKIEGTNIVFSILFDSDKLAIPVIYKEKFDLDELIGGLEDYKALSYSNWELKLVEELDKFPYYINTFKNGVVRDIDYEVTFNCDNEYNYIQGKYSITDLQTGETIYFYLRNIDHYFSIRSYICNDYLIDTSNSKYDKLFILSLINEILYKNGGNYKRTNIKSK